MKALSGGGCATRRSERLAAVGKLSFDLTDCRCFPWRGRIVARGIVRTGRRQGRRTDGGGTRLWLLLCFYTAHASKQNFNQGREAAQHDWLRSPGQMSARQRRHANGPGAPWASGRHVYRMQPDLSPADKSSPRNQAASSVETNSKACLTGKLFCFQRRFFPCASDSPSRVL